MNSFFDTEEDRIKFMRRLNALSNNSDFTAVLEVLRIYQGSMDGLLRYVEDDVKLRHLQGKAQAIGELVGLCDLAKTGNY